MMAYQHTYLAYLICIVESIVHETSNEGCLSDWEDENQLFVCKPQVLPSYHSVLRGIPTCTFLKDY